MDIARSIKRSFWRGLAALLPALLTVIVLGLGISFLHNYVGRYVNLAIQYVLHWTTGLSLAWIQEWYDRYWLGALGVVVAVVGLCVVAYFVGTFLGNRLVRFVDAWMSRMPVLRRIYPGAKQVTEFFFSEKKVEFRRVVAIEYPRRGVWSIGFVTGRALKALCRRTEQELLTVFVPSSPTPVTGYIVAVPRREVIDLDLTVDQAFEFTISGGVIVPEGERLESFEAARLLEAAAAARAARKTAEAEAPSAGEAVPPPADAAAVPPAAPVGAAEDLPNGPAAKDKGPDGPSADARRDPSHPGAGDAAPQGPSAPSPESRPDPEPRESENP